MSVFSAHRQAMVALLNGSAKPSAIAIYNEKVPSGAPRQYVRVYFTVERPVGDSHNSLDGKSATISLRAICHCVGATDAAALAVAHWVETAWLDVRPTITGRACGQITQEAALEPDSDESTGVLVMDAVQIYRLTTTPA